MMLDDDGGQMLLYADDDACHVFADASVDAMQASSRTSGCRCLSI